MWTLGHHATRTNVQTIYDLHGLNRHCPERSRPKLSFEDWLSAYYLHSFWPNTLASFSPASPCPFCSHACPTRLNLQIARAPTFFVDVSDWDLETNPFHVLHLQQHPNILSSMRCNLLWSKPLDLSVDHIGWTCLESQWAGTSRHSSIRWKVGRTLGTFKVLLFTHFRLLYPFRFNICP